MDLSGAAAAYFRPGQYRRIASARFAERWVGILEGMIKALAADGRVRGAPHCFGLNTAYDTRAEKSRHGCDLCLHAAKNGVLLTVESLICKALRSAGGKYAQESEEDDGALCA